MRMVLSMALSTVSVICMVAAGIIALRKNRSENLFAVLGLILGPLGVLAAVLVSPGVPKGMQAVSCPRCNAKQNIPAGQTTFECCQCKHVAHDEGDTSAAARTPQAAPITPPANAAFAPVPRIGTGPAPLGVGAGKGTFRGSIPNDYACRRAIAGSPAPERFQQMMAVVKDLLAQHWSPAQISRSLRRTFADRPDWHLPHRRRSTRSFIGPTACCCADRHPRRCAPGAITAAPICASPGVGGVSPNRCSACTSARSVRRTVLSLATGKATSSSARSIGRRSAHWSSVRRRLVKLIHLARPDSFELRDGLLRELAGLPALLLQSITWDQGSEMARHLEITAVTGAKVYFCDAGSPWQRGTNENTNGLLRQYFPKGTDLSRHNRGELARVERELNNRPPAVLHDRTPAEIFTQLLTSKKIPMLQ